MPGVDYPGGMPASMLVPIEMHIWFTYATSAKKERTSRAVPIPFYYRRVDRRRQLFSALGIGLACTIAVPLFILFVYIYFFV